MIVSDSLFLVLFIYLSLYCLWQLFFYIKANDITKYFEKTEKERDLILEEKKFCVVIYANYLDKNLDKLLEVLNLQTYTKENYDVNVVYERLERDTSNQRDFAFGAKFHNIENPDYFSKDKALNLFIQKIVQDEEANYDAFIFLDADRMVGERFLENINKTVKDKKGVFIGSKVSTNQKDKFTKKVKNAILSSYLKYVNRTKDIVRAMFKLPFLIDGGNVTITNDVIEKMGYVGLEDKDSELEYSYDLASNNIYSTYSPYIISAVDINNYDFSSPAFKNKFKIFFKYLPLLLFKSNAYREFVFFLLKPNSLVAITAFILMIVLSFYSNKQTIHYAAWGLLGFWLFSFIFSVKVTKMRAVEVFWLLFYPICLAWQKLKIFINNLTIKSIIEGKYEEENVNSATISAVANNGKKDFVCKLDLVSEDGMRKVVFREGGRFIRTDSHLRMYDALSDITYKLKSKGISLKTCQNCKNFVLCPDGTLDCLNGKCQISQSEILIWNGCQYFNQKND